MPLVKVDVSQPLTSADTEVEWPEPGRATIAYLQYTSGSTRSPAGVMITHENVVRNARQVLTSFPGSTVVSWLPLFHDMGLVVNICMPVVGGFPSVLMDPVAVPGPPGALAAAYRRAPERVRGRAELRLRLLRRKVRPEAGRGTAARPGARAGQRRAGPSAAYAAGFAAAFAGTGCGRKNSVPRTA